MNLFQIFAVVLTLSALFSYVNERFIRLPSAIGLMISALSLSVILQVLAFFSRVPLEWARNFMEKIDFSETLLNFMLSFMLFAAALHADVGRLRSAKGPIITFATVGVILTIFAVGSGLYFLFQLFSIHVLYVECLLFGALISPTDPLAVLGILQKAQVPKSVEIKIVGESLFNDGIGMVAFLILIRMATRGIDQTSFGEVGLLLLEEVVGGVAFGLALGYAGYLLLRSIDHYQTEVLITIALVIGGSLLAQALHFSGPLAMVTSGILIGSRGREQAMSEVTMDYTFKFWELIDEILNASLFVLIGLELLVVPLRWEFLWIGLLCVPILLGARYGALTLISLALGYKSEFEPATISIMTWGGLRGGISIALALLIPSNMNNNLFISITYIIVLFSILVQGLTLQPVIRKLRPE